MSADSRRGQPEACGSDEKRVWLNNLRALWLGQFWVTAGLTVIVPLLPFYLEEIGCRDPEENRFWTGWTLAAPAIPLMIMAPVWGRLGDRFGRKVMVVRALFGISLAVLIMGLATNPLHFFLARLFQGMFGGVDDAACAFTSTEAPDAEKGRVVGLLQSATAAGALLGPLAGAFCASLWGFAPVVLATAALIFAAGVVCAGVLREAPCRVARAKASPAGRVLLSLLTAPAARAVLLAGFFVQVGSYALIAAFAQRVRDLVVVPEVAARWVGALQSLTWAATLLGAMWWGRRNDRSLVERNFAVAAVGCALHVAAQAFASRPEWLVPLRAGQGFFASALGQSVFLRMAQGAAAVERGFRIGIANSLLTSGQVAGALVGAALAGAFSASELFLILSGAFWIAAALVIHGEWLQRRNPIHVRSVSP